MGKKADADHTRKQHAAIQKTAPKQPPLDDDVRRSPTTSSSSRADDVARKPKRLSVADWAPLNEAFERAKAVLSSSDLALRDLHDDLRSGRLPSAERSIARDGTETSGEVEASFWQLVTMWEFPHRSGQVAVRFVDPRTVAPFSRWYFVARRELDRLYPAGSAPVDHDDASDTPPPRAKPGPKPHKDWPTMLAQWLIAVAADDPQRLQNVDALVVEAQDFLDKQINWSPSDDKVLRAKIRELLTPVRR